jgi:general secretion pathway protein G
MEMLVVVAIIVALMGIGGYYYFAQLDKANDTKALSQVRDTLTKAVATYRTDHNDWPPNLQVLLQRTGDGYGPYLETEEALIDPWNRPYQYNPAGPNNRGLKPDIWSDGPRGQIGNWSTKR